MRAASLPRQIERENEMIVISYRLFKETLIQSLSDFTLEVLCIARNNLTRIASYVRKAMTKLCIKRLVGSDSVIESAFP